MKTIFSHFWLVAAGFVIVLGTSGSAQTTDENPTYSNLPVKEVTIFKDGHAYMMHEGRLATDVGGNVLLDYLPTPIMGAFWAHSFEPDAKLVSVVSSRQMVDVEKESATLHDLVRGNIGADVIIKDTINSFSYPAAISKVLEPENKIVLLKVAEGIRAVPLEMIQTLTFVGHPNTNVFHRQQKDTLTLALNWNGNRPESQANVGLAYIQRGLRWIPGYRIEIDGKGHAVVKLQATLVNELADLQNVTAHLVIGVPSFAFKETPDPISFQETIAQLSSHFRTDSRTAAFLSNAIMSQRALGVSSPTEPIVELSPELTDTAQSEDLFFFTLEHVTLKKGQRMVVPITEFELSYRDIYTLSIPFSPPLELARSLRADQQTQLAKLFDTPAVLHKLRFNNTSAYPLTTAPTTIFKEGRVLAQGMMGYTAVGNQGDLELTTAVNIRVNHAQEQKNFIPDAARWSGDAYVKVEMLGTIELTNFTDRPVTLEVQRSILGTMEHANLDGQVKQLGHGYYGLSIDRGLPMWWGWFNWPWWWYRFNGVGQADWTIELDPTESITLTYQWHYYWR